MKKKPLKEISKFKTEDEEREFWSRVDSTEYVDWSDVGQVTFPNLRPSVKLEKGLNGYVVASCPALPGCVSQGKTQEEALKNIKEAIDLYIADPKDLSENHDKYLYGDRSSITKPTDHPPRPKKTR